MRRSKTQYPSISAVLGLECLTTHFQPIVSVKQHRVVGLEALSRGVDGHTGELVPPRLLFQNAAMEGLTLELDRQCRLTALERFAPLHQRDPRRLCFLNIAADIILPGIVGSSHLVSTAERLGIDPRCVVVEINEARNGDLSALQEFVERYHAYGFLIALDNVGMGHSDLGRIPLLKPDILKIDRALLRDIDVEECQQVVVASLVTMGHQIGAQVVAEGIEREAEALIALELDADLLQGFFFAEPAEEVEPVLAEVMEPLRHTTTAFQQAMIRRIRDRRARHHEYDQLLRAVAQALAVVRRERFDEVLTACSARFPLIDGLYVLNGAGVQTTETVLNPHKIASVSPLYHPACAGDDHSAKEYFYLLANTSIDKYTTTPYISLATGALCVTVSTLFRDADGYGFVLCCDMPAE